MSQWHESPILIIVGTRPEGIKMAPVYLALKQAGIPTLLCSTMQHSNLLEDVFDLFDIKPDIRLDIMRPGQDLFYVTQAVLQKTKEVFLTYHPSLVLVQGDTTSTMAASLAAFYLGIPLGHIEAGLRTNEIMQPFPEEMNRRFISMVAQYHFAPTAGDMAHLLKEGVASHKIFCTGNTIVDALSMIREKIRRGLISIRRDIRQKVHSILNENRSLGLLTLHRRESFDGSIESILQTLVKWAKKNPDTTLFYPYHPNPMVINAIRNSGILCLDNFYICEPLQYKDLVYLLDKARYVLTDSGGIQEEAVSLSKPVLVLREKTERFEGVNMGAARVIGSDPQAIFQGMAWASQFDMRKFDGAQVYGDGHAAQKIVAFIQAHNGHFVGQINIKKEASKIETQEIQKDSSMKKVCIIGLGYIGLPTAIIAAESGYDVIGYDIDQERVSLINNGNPIIHEPEAYEKLQLVIGSQCFKAYSTIQPAQYFIIAVPTPINDDKTIDLSAVFSAVDAIANVLDKENVVIIESTIKVNTTRKIADRLSKKTGMRAGIDFYVAHCPERVLPGNIFYELIANDRIIGGVNKESMYKAKMFYESFVNGKLFLTSAEAAEMVKLIENSSRDVQLAFAHQVASIAQSIGLDAYEIISLANKHPRVTILQPSCGVGGHCIAIDPWFLIESFPEHTSLIQSARLVNDAKPFDVLRSIYTAIENWKQEKKRKPFILLLGLSYKPNIEDLRESPALKIAQECILKSSADVIVADPHVDRNILKNYFNTHYISSISEGLEKADIVVFLVAHDRFRLLDKKLLKNKIVLDFCGVRHEVKTGDDEYTYWPDSFHSSLNPYQLNNDAELI